MKSPRTISTYQIIYEGEEIIEEKLLNVSRLNEGGKVLQREQYDEAGNLIKKEAYQYEGELVVMSSEEDLLENRVTKTICVYQDNLLMNQKEYFNDALSIEMIYNYNEQGQLIEHQVLNNDGSINSKYTYEYEGQKTIEKFFDEEMTLVRITETVKGDIDQIIEKKVTEIYEDREVTMLQKIEYSVTEEETSRNYYNNGVEVYEITEVFDEDGRVKEKITYDVANDEESVTTLEYDSNGKIIKEEISIDEEVVSETSLEFDEFENRVKLVKYSKLAEDYYDTVIYKFVNEY